jgi:hypothetical protein
MSDFLTWTNGIALFGLLFLVGVGIYFWVFGERTETHQEEKVGESGAHRNAEGGSANIHTSEFEDAL